MHVIPLHVHSHWSLLDGVPSISDLIGHAQAADLPALALTDRNALYGAMEFVAACRPAGIAPLLGAELDLAGGTAIILLAQNMEGYGNLCRLITRLQAAPDRAATLAGGLAPADIAAHTRGLVALSGGRQGPIDALLRQGSDAQAERAACEWRELFGRDRFWIELQFVEPEDAVRVAALDALAGRLHLGTVATHDIHYLAPGDAPRYHILTAIRTRTLRTHLPPLPDLSFPSEEGMRRRFAAYPGALDATQALAQQCHFAFPTGQWHFPALSLPAGQTPRQALWAEAIAGAERRYGTLTPTLEARLCKEVDTIDTLGYTPYFFVVADIVRFARQQAIPISPRGSASSSVVAYCLGIHDIDPIAHNLYFERFLSLERHDPPDIDLDLCSRRRDEVIRYVYERYGADHVAMVCTYATLRARYALHEAGKACGLPEKRLRELSRQLPGFWHPGARRELAAAQAEMIAQAHDPLEREVLELSRELDGTPHHLSVHPGGIVIAPGPITDLVPLQHATKGLLVTQFDMGGIDKSGLIKIDLLGISALTVMADCVDLIREREPKFALDRIPLEDPQTALTLSTANTIGCFQIESPGMRMTLRELTARRTADVLVALALYRPGPLKGGLKDAFVRRHLGQEATLYAHPALEPILRETYGVILYQEQVLRIAHEVAGFSLGTADTLRRAMSKFRSAHEMDRLRADFIAGALTTSGIAAAVAQQIWELMAAFAGYGFPKAHAAGYAVVAYRMAYLKTHYPAEFLAARLAVWGGFYRPGVYLSEARRLGLRVKPPHVNHSRAAVLLEAPRTLWMGLDQVRELTRVTIRALIAERPFDSLQDVLIRAQPSHGEAVNLVKAGALDGLGRTGEMLACLEREPWKGRHTGQMGLLAAAPAPAAPEPTAAERAAWEREILGQWVGVHPLELCDDCAAEKPILSSELGQYAGRQVAVRGIRVALHRLASRQERMWLVDMEDEDGMYQVLWSGAPLTRYRTLLTGREPVLIRGRVRTDRQGQIVVAGQEIRSIGRAP